MRAWAISGIIVSVILMAGFLGYTVSNPEAFASGQGKGNDADKGKEGHGVKGCVTAHAASQGKTNNPHCECSSDADCSDGDVCNGDEACEAGQCTAGTPLNCDDGNVCTADSCDAETGCRNEPVNGPTGRTCDTGRPGVCAEGIEVCRGGALTCQPRQSPSPERCDGLDNDCDGAVDEGGVCLRNTAVSCVCIFGPDVSFCEPISCGEADSLCRNSCPFLAGFVEDCEPNSC